MASTIYIGGFPPSCTQGQLRQIFVPFGKVESVEVLQDTRGYCVGVVQMSSPDEVEHIFGAQQVFQVEGKHLDIWEPPDSESAQN
jgi:RNA recognition motif-containing protein